MKLFTKTLLLFLALFAVIAIAVSALSARVLYGNLTGEYRNTGIAIAQGLVDAGTETVLNADLATVQAAVDQFAEIKGVAYVFVSNDQDEIISHTFVPAVPAQIPSLVTGASDRGLRGDTESTTVTVDGFGDVLHVTAPMLAGTAGYAHVGMDLGFIHDQIRSAIVQQQLVFAVIFLLALLAAFIFMRRISQPIAALANYTRELADSDFSHELDIPHSAQPATPGAGDEVGQLARAFSEMADRLRQHIEDLKRTTAAKERIESELGIARDIQMGLVPHTFPPYPHRQEFDLHGCLVPAREVGGDFYDFFFIDEERLCVAIADVSDKGVPASLFMALTRTLLRAIARDPGMDPAAIMQRMNREISRDNDSCMFVTAFCAFVHIHSGDVTYCNAGHNPPLLAGPQGIEPVPARGGVALGMTPTARFELGEFRMAPGDLLMMYTDGITEAMDPQNRPFGTRRLAAALDAARAETCAELLERVLAEVHEFASGAPQSDDITMLALRYAGPEGHGERILSLKLDSGDSRVLKQLMDAWEDARTRAGLPDDIAFKARLALEELVLNIVQHGTASESPVQLLVRIDRMGSTLAFEVRDDGPAFDPASAPPPDTGKSLEDRQPGGLGLHLVRKMTRDFAYHRDGRHNVVTFRLLLDAGPD